MPYLHNTDTCHIFLTTFTVKLAVFDSTGCADHISESQEVVTPKFVCLFPSICIYTNVHTTYYATLNNDVV